MQPPAAVNTPAYVLDRIIGIGLVFLLAAVPLIINPLAVDFYYRPKIQAVYALVLIVALAAGMRLFAGGHAFRLRAFPLRWPLAAFCLTVIVATLFSIDPKLSLWGDPWRMESTITLLAYTATAALFACLPSSYAQVMQLLRWLLLTGGVVAGYGLAQYAGFNVTRHWIPLFDNDQVKSTIGNANFLGKFLVLLLPLYIAFFLNASRRSSRILYGAGFLAGAAALFVTFTRASWLGFCVSMGVFVLLAGSSGRRRARRIVPFFLAGAALFILVFVSLAALNRDHPQAQRIFAITDRLMGTFDIREGKGVATRLFVWQKTVQLIRERPLFGYGPDTHVIPLRAFNLEYSRRFNGWTIIDRAHNNYLDLALAQGLAGLTAYLALLATMLALLVRNMRTACDERRRVLYAGVLAAFAGYLINDVFIFSVVSVSPTFWALMGLACAIERVNTNDRQT